MPKVSRDSAAQVIDHGAAEDRMEELDGYIEAGYEGGALTLRIPIAERAKPRKIAIADADHGAQQINA